MWNLATSYLAGLPYPSASLVLANEPWSGHYEPLPTLAVTGELELLLFCSCAC